MQEVWFLACGYSTSEFITVVEGKRNDAPEKQTGAITFKVHTLQRIHVET